MEVIENNELLKEELPNLVPVDIDAYADRFGEIFNSTSRYLSNPIDISTLKSICDKLGIKVPLIVVPDEYADDRFGENFQSTKRLLKGSSITHPKLKSNIDKLGRCTLTITDKS